jgi:[acyl-carrier-protein] S-malonyltransferase
MGKSWAAASPAAREVFDRADAALGASIEGVERLSRVCFEGPIETLNRTDVSQPAIYTTSVACWAALRERWGSGEHTPALCAGLSLGEYTALHIAGVFGFEEGLRLVAQRGRAMQQAATAVASGMVALIGADEAGAMAVCERSLALLAGDAASAGGPAGEVLVPANFNAPGQIVLSGSRAAVAKAESVAGEMGLRATVLQVAGAFHSPIMGPARRELELALGSTLMRPPVCPVLSNVTGRPHGEGLADGGEGALVASIRARLGEQLTSPVRWAQSCAWAVGAGGAYAGVELVELAPGRTLAGLMRRIEKGAKVQSYDEAA